MNNYSGWSKVEVACKWAANKQAKYGEPKWPWVFYFSHYHPGTNYVSSGVVVAIEPEAQFQNGYGAMVHSRVVCTYDLRAQRVTDVVISEN